jgi:PAS domain S-box-containing protein
MHISILHIEDSRVQIFAVQAILKAALSDEDYSYESCSSLCEAISLLNRNKYDIILLDLGLPDSIGVRTIELLRETIKSIPILVLTGEEDISIAKAAIHAGASAYVRKSDINALPLLAILTVEKWGIERALAERCVLYDSIVNTTPDYICRFAPNYKITFVNEAFCSLVHETADNIIGTRICDYLPDEVHDKFNNCTDLVRDLCVLTNEGEFLLNDRWVAWRATAVRDMNGKIKEVQCVGRDVTYKHRETQELLTIARNRMSEQQASVNASVDEAFNTLMETEHRLSQIENGVSNGNGIRKLQGA